jgi:hypothetical protein
VLNVSCPFTPEVGGALFMVQPLIAGFVPLLNVPDQMA